MPRTRDVARLLAKSNQITDDLSKIPKESNSKAHGLHQQLDAKSKYLNDVLNLFDKIRKGPHIVVVVFGVTACASN